MYYFENRKEFRDNRNIKDEVAIREKLYDGQSRILCFEAYGDPYPRPVRDIQRVWKMGAGYSKRGKVHQQYQRRDGKFHSGDSRRKQFVKSGLGKVKKLNRKPGEYDLPVFDHIEHIDDVPDYVKHTINQEYNHGNNTENKNGNEIYEDNEPNESNDNK